MNFRDLETGQQFRFVALSLSGYGVCTKVGGPGEYTCLAVKNGYLAKRARTATVMPIGDPPAPEPRDPSQEDLQDLLRIARVELLLPSLDRDTILAAILTTLEVLVRKS